MWVRVDCFAFMHPAVVISKRGSGVGRPQASLGPRLVLGDDFVAKCSSGESFLTSFETQQRKFVRPVRVQPEGARGVFTGAILLAHRRAQEQIAGRLCWTRDADLTCAQSPRVSVWARPPARRPEQSGSTFQYAVIPSSRTRTRASASMTNQGAA